VTKFLTEREL